MKSVPAMVLFCIYLLIWEYRFVSAMSCDSCGSECARACGTRHFRTCCFNYVRKRSNSMHPYPLNNANFDILYGPMMDYEMMRRSSEKSPKSLLGRDSNKNFENLMIENDESKSQQNFYKPWKESNNHMDNMILFNDYEQQNNRQGHEQQKQQQQPLTYDA